jgi:hypothetical protein
VRTSRKDGLHTTSEHESSFNHSLLRIPHPLKLCPASIGLSFAGTRCDDPFFVALGLLPQIFPPVTALCTATAPASSHQAKAHLPETPLRPTQQPARPWQRKVSTTVHELLNIDPTSNRSFTAIMTLENGAVCAQDGIAPATLCESDRPKKQQLDEFLVKESFVPTRPQTRKRRVVVRRRKQKEENGFAAVCAWVVDSQLGTSMPQLPTPLGYY